MEKDPSEGLDRNVKELTAQVGRVAKALEKQNDLRRRLVTGLVFGIGTAIGASVIATIIVVLTARLLAPIGIDLISTLQESRQVLEKQIQNQTPQ